MPDQLDPQVSTIDSRTAYSRMLEKLPQAISDALNVDGIHRSLKVNRVWIDTSKHDQMDLDDFQEAKMREGTMTAPVYADISLMDKATGREYVAKDGKPVRAKSMIVGHVPVLTPNGGYLINGVHYAVHHQMRLDPSIYTVVRDNGELFSAFNLAHGSKGRRMGMSFDSDSGVLNLVSGTSKIPLLPILHAMGIPDERIANYIGGEMLAQQRTAVKDEAAEVMRAAQLMTGDKFPNPNAAAQGLRDFFTQTKLDAKAVGRVHGVEGAENHEQVYGTLSPELMLMQAKKHMAVYRGEAEPDDRNSLLHKTVHGADDHIPGRFGHWRNKNLLQQKLRAKVDSFDSVKRIVSESDISRVINKYFLSATEGGAGLIQVSEENNPVQLMADARKITLLGEGGISGSHSVPHSVRAMHPSQFGIVDPVMTPEGGKVGTVMNVAHGARRIGNKMGTELIDIQNGGAKTAVPLDDYYGKVVALPNQFYMDPDGFFRPRNPRRVRAMQNGKMIMAPPDGVDYMMPSPAAMYGKTALLVPMLGAVSGARGMIGGKMIEQALPLVDADTPLVRAVVDGKAPVDDPETGGARVSTVDGVVEMVEPNRIHVRTADGKLVKHGIYNHLPTQSNALFHHTPVVKPGDNVKAGQVLADSSFTRGGTLAIGKNLMTALLPDRGHTFEDGISISESAAKKLTSRHIAVKEFPLEEGSIADLNKFRVAYPGHITESHAARMDPDGIIKVGEKVGRGEHVILGLRRRVPTQEEAVLSKVSRKLYKPLTNAAVTWDQNDQGTVVRVDRLKDKIKVYVQYDSPAKVGDKMSGMGYGDKGIIAAIHRDEQMPVTRDGRRVEVLFNPLGYLSRKNPGAHHEGSFGSMAQRDGKPIYIESFTSNNYDEMVDAGLKERGIPDGEDLIDPETQRVIPRVKIGPRYFMKLKHRVEDKFSARDTAGYDVDGAPLRGGEEGAKRTDPLQLTAILAHGANNLAEDIAVRKSTRNDDMWRAIKMGQPLPPAKPTMATEKFLALLNVAGINPVKTGNQITLMPLTDRTVLERSNGQVLKPGLLMAGAQGAKPEEGGLFDPAIVGGQKLGGKWAHVTLSEPFPSPVMEDAIKSVAGLSTQEFEGLVSGRMGLAGGGVVEYAPGMPTGGVAIASLLEKVNPQAEFDALREQLKTEKSRAAIDKLSKRGKYLRGLIKAGMTPNEAYLINHVPVLPPQYRPAIPLPNGQLSLGGLNNLYRDLMLVNEKLGAFKDLGHEHTADLRETTYDALKALQGLGDPVSGRDYRGVLRTVSGVGSPKYGMIQRKLLGRPMDAVGRSTIIPDPGLHIDEVGIPEDMAWRSYQAFAVRELVRSGIPPLKAAEEVEQRTPRAAEALDKAMMGRPVTLNRAPSLHKFSILAFNAKRVPGDALQIPPLVFKGFNADTDGDSMFGDVIVRVGQSPPTVCSMISLVKVSKRITERKRKRTRHEGGSVIVYEPPKGLQALSLVAGAAPTWMNVSQVSLHQGLTMFEVSVSGVPSPIIVSKDASLVTVDPETGLQSATLPKDAFNRLVPSVMDVDCSDWQMRGRDTDTVRGFKDGFTMKLPKPIDLLGVAVPSSATKKIGQFGSESFDYRLGYICGMLRRADIDKIKTPTFSGKVSAIASKFYAATVGMHLRYLNDGKSFTVGGVNLRVETAKRLFRAIQKGDIENFHHSLPLDPTELLQKLEEYGESHEFVELPSRGGYCYYLIGGWLFMESEAHFRRNYVPFPRKQLWKDADKVLDKRGSMDFRAIYRRERSRFNHVGEMPMDVMPRVLAAAFLIKISKKYPAMVNTTGFRMLSAYCYSSVSYERIRGILQLNKPGAGFDFNVPLADVFCEAGGVSLKNTMMVSVPISDAAVKEARETMMPSQNLFNPGTHGLMILPSKESLWGLWSLSKAGKQTNKTYADMDGAMKDYLEGKLEATDVIKAGGVETTPGRIELNSHLPEPLRDYSKQFDDAHLKKVLTSIAKEDPKGYDKAVFGLKAAGDDAAYFMGMTVRSADIAPARAVRDKILKEAERQYDSGAPTEERLVQIYGHANKVLENALDEHYRDNPNMVWDMIKSGAMGKKAQAMQLLSAPLLVNDETGKPIPFPVNKSYSEGLDIDDYVATLYGERKGIIDRAISTAEPGEIQKETIVAALNQQIDQKDCGAHGEPLSINDKSIYYRILGEDLHVGNRLLAKRGDPITHEVVDAARAAGIKDLNARGAKHCESTHGICQVCAGLNDHGEFYPIGFNVGALAATTISEPLTQGVLTNFHKGNTTFSKTISGLDRVRQLIELPKMAAGQGPLASADGVVEKIENTASGDYRVTIDGKNHFVPRGMILHVAEGDEVKRGDALSSGVKNPHELLSTKGVGAARDYLVNEMHSTYKDGNNIDLDRRHFEVIAKALSDHAYIEDPGDAPALIRGDYMPLSKVEGYNKLLREANKKEIEYTPQLKGAVQSAIATDDWLARTSSRMLTRKLQEAAGFGLSTNVGAGGHPIPRYIYGAHMAEKVDMDPQRPTSIHGLKLEDLEFSGPVFTATPEKPLSPETPDKI